jgi:cytoskeletal protein CcmA (bactofilin family)
VKRLIKKSKYSKEITLDRIDEDVEAFLDVIICKGVFVRGKIVANNGSVYVEPGAIIKGDIFAGINVFVDEDALVVGAIKSFAIENRGEIEGGIIETNHFMSFGKSSGKIKAKMVLLGEYAIHEGEINAMCLKIDTEARHLKEDN